MVRDLRARYGAGKRFYESVFQVKLERLNAPDLEIWAFPMEMDKAGASGALVKMEGVQSRGNSTLVYFHSADCSVEAARVVKTALRSGSSHLNSKA